MDDVKDFVLDSLKDLIFKYEEAKDACEDAGTDIYGSYKQILHLWYVQGKLDTYKEVLQAFGVPDDEIEDTIERYRLDAW